MRAALKRLDHPSSQAVMLGDTAYDSEAATKVTIPTIAFRCGGWSDDDLRGAIAIYNDPADLLAQYDTSPLVKEFSIQP